MGFTIERVQLDDPLVFYEQIGDPVSDFGGTTVPAPRTALRHSISLPTFTNNATLDTVAARLVLRRQLRSLLNNTQYKLQGFYVNWAEDPEQNGWYVPDMGQLADGQDSSGLATGFWKLENVVWRKQAARRTHRRAVNVTMLPITTGFRWRDYRRTLYNADFASLTPLAITYLPASATDITNSSSYQAVTSQTLRAGSDGGACVLVPGQPNLTTLSFEQPETSQTQCGVLVFDRNGFIAASETTGWSEVYGPDWPWYWPTTSTGEPDAPVLENGYTRVRFDNTNTPGFRVDVWTGTAWVEQCKVWFQRYNSGLATPVAVADATLLSAGLEEYGQERAVMKVVMSEAGNTDTSSREMIYVTLQRGWSGPRFELYPGPTATATPLAVAGWICITPSVGTFATPVLDTDDSVFALFGLPTNAGLNISTALGTGHTGLFTTTDLAVPSSLSDNGFAMLRSTLPGTFGATPQATAYQINVGVVQAAANIVVGPTSNAYAVPANTLILEGPQTGDYCSAQLGFTPAFSLQVMEAENMSIPSGSSVSNDATASQSVAVSATRTSDNPALQGISQGPWPTVGHPAVYRVFVRCRTTAGTMSVYARTYMTGPTNITVGPTKTLTSTSYIWVDLGDLTTSSVATTLDIHAWTTSGTCYVDRVEAYLRQDQTAVAAQYQGCQDLGQSILYDSQQLGVQVSRA